MARWTFLTSHALVLIFLNNHPKITGHELALSIGITERAVRRVIADLEAEGYIEKQREGRRVRYTINHRVRFRHPTQRDKEIGILLEAVGREPEPTRSKPSIRKRSNSA